MPKCDWVKDADGYPRHPNANPHCKTCSGRGVIDTGGDLGGYFEDCHCIKMRMKPFQLAIGDKFTIDDDNLGRIYTRLHRDIESADIWAVDENHHLINLTGTANVTKVETQCHTKDTTASK